MKFLRKMYDWMSDRVNSRYADLWLIIFFFAEASFSIIPADPLLILYCINMPKRAFYYAGISTAASVIGGMFGYAIGFLVWQHMGIGLIKWLISEKTFFVLVAKYKMYQNVAVLLSGFVLVPYKAITISAGFCNLSFIPFVLCSLISRGVRFYLEAGAIVLWGAAIKGVIDRFFNYLVIAFIILLFLSFKIIFS